MEEKIRNLIENLTPRELELLENELNRGAPTIKRYINKKKEEYERTHRICATCFNEIDEEKEHYAIIFGPKGFQKRATFCGLDCMMYFIKNHFKEIKKIIKEEKS